MKQVLFLLIATFFVACSTSKIATQPQPEPKETVFGEIWVNVVQECDTTTTPFFQLAVQTPKNVPSGWKIDNYNVYFRINENEDYTHKSFLYDSDFTVPLFFMATEMKFSVSYRSLTDPKLTKQVFTQSCVYDKDLSKFVKIDYVFTTKCDVNNSYAKSKKQMKLFITTPNGMQTKKQ